MFFILCSRPTPQSEWTPNFNTRYDDPAKAAAEAKRSNDYNTRWGYGTRWRVRKVVDTDDDNFIAREAAKNHTPIPWERSEYHNQYYNYMLPHIDPDDATKVRFFATIEDAVTCKYRSMKLTRFLTNYEDFTEEERNEILIKCGYWDGKMELHFTTDIDLIQKVYEEGPTSCMADPDDYALPDDPHPVAVYSEGDLALAYLETNHGYAARAIVYPEKQLYYSIYGHVSLLREKLKEAGYVKCQNDGRGFHGAKVAAIGDGGSYLMPYIDVAENAELSSCGKFFILGEGPYFVRSTDGYVEFEEDNDDYYDDY